MKKKTRMLLILRVALLLVLIWVVFKVMIADEHMDALDDWLEEHKEEIEDYYLDLREFGIY